MSFASGRDASQADPTSPPRLRMAPAAVKTPRFKVITILSLMLVVAGTSLMLLTTLAAGISHPPGKPWLKGGGGEHQGQALGASPRGILPAGVGSDLGVTEAVRTSHEWALNLQAFPPSSTLKVSSPSQLLAPISTTSTRIAAQTALQKRFHILTTVYGNASSFKQCVAHLLAQEGRDWHKTHWYIIHDPDDSGMYSDVQQVVSEALQGVSAPPLTISIFRNTRRMGPGYSKWFLFQYVAAIAGKNDVVMVLDGDDYLSDDFGLSYINAQYLAHKPYTTYGSCFGMYCDQQGPLGADESPRQRWRYSHPRTFVGAHLGFLTRHDFQDEVGEWLMKGTDRMFTYKALDAAGPGRTLFIDRVLYAYTDSPLSSFKLMPPPRRKHLIDELNSRPSIGRVAPAIHVIMCLFDRVGQLPRVLHMLNEQVLPQGTSTHLWICNNNASASDLIEDMVASDAGDVAVHVFNMGENTGGFGRYLLASWLLHNAIEAPYLVMLDEDIVFHGTDVLARVHAAGKPQTYNCWYGKQFAHGSGYWDNQVISGQDIRTQGKPEVSSFHYCGAGLSVVDSNIFESPAVLAIPRKYMLVEDLWLSAIAAHHGYTLGRIFVDAEMLVTPRELWMAKDMHALKDEFLTHIRGMGYPY